MIPRSMMSFLGKMLQATDNGDLKWNLGAPDSFYCNHNYYEIHINSRFDPDDGESTIYFLIKNKEHEAYFSVSNDENDFLFIKGLYETISFNAAGFGNIEDDFFA